MRGSFQGRSNIVEDKHWDGPMPTLALPNRARQRAVTSELPVFSGLPSSLAPNRMHSVERVCLCLMSHTRVHGLVARFPSCVSRMSGEREAELRTMLGRSRLIAAPMDCAVPLRHGYRPWRFSQTNVTRRCRLFAHLSGSRLLFVRGVVIDQLTNRAAVAYLKTASKTEIAPAVMLAFQRSRADLASLCH